MRELSVVIPVMNEEDNIKPMIEAVDVDGVVHQKQGTTVLIK